MSARATLTTALLALAMASGAGFAVAQDVVAARTLRAGSVLTSADLLAGGTGGAVTEARLGALVGLETRRAIYAGRPVLEADLGPPVLVRRNAVVTMTYRDGALTIRAEGRALESGGSGEIVRVINLTSRQTVAARVSGQDRVEVQ